MPDDPLIWAALADSKRRQIINLLEEKPRTTSELSEFFDVSRFAVMKHLNVLEQANLIKVKREGRNRWNSLNNDLVHFLRTKLTDEDGPFRLEDILGLLPGRNPRSSILQPVASFYFQKRILLEAPPPQVFKALTSGIDDWWEKRIAANSRMHLEPYVNGRFYEAFDKDCHGALYATVTYIKKDSEIRLRGTMGLEEVFDGIFPDGLVSITLEAQENATQFSLSHRLINHGDENVHEICRHHWHTLLDKNLKSFVEKRHMHEF